MKIITTNGIADIHTNLICNILADKYPELTDKKGRFSHEHIPLTPKVIKYLNALQDEYKKVDEAFFDERRIEFILNSIIELYQPVVQRVRVRFDKSNERTEENKKFFQSKTKKKLEAFSKQALILSKEIDSLKDLFENNLDKLDDSTIALYNDKKYDLSNTLIQVSERMDYIVENNYK